MALSEDQRDELLREEADLNREIYLKTLSETVARNLDINKQTLLLQEKVIVMALATLALSVNAIISLVSQHILQGHHHIIFLLLVFVGWSSLLLSIGNGWNSMMQIIRASKSYSDSAERLSLIQNAQAMKSLYEHLKYYKGAPMDQDIKEAQQRLDSLNEAETQARKPDQIKTLDHSRHSLSLLKFGLISLCLAAIDLVFTL